MLVIHCVDAPLQKRNNRRPRQNHVEAGGALRIGESGSHDTKDNRSPRGVIAEEQFALDGPDGQWLVTEDSPL